MPGHWEGDLIIGAGGHSQVGMLTERTTRYTMLFPLPRGPFRTRGAQLARPVDPSPPGASASIVDLGQRTRDGRTPRSFASRPNIDVFFCDPGHPWQRGTAENTIGLVRAYLPKGTDLSRYNQRRLDNIAVMLNERPRKTLNWQSPAEAYAQRLAVQ